MRRVLLLLPLLSLACPTKEEPEPLPSGPPPTTTTTLPTTTLPKTTLPKTTQELPKFELGQLKSDPEIAAKSKAHPDGGTTLFDKPCEDPAAVKCKP